MVNATTARLVRCKWLILIGALYSLSNFSFALAQQIPTAPPVIVPAQTQPAQTPNPDLGAGPAPNRKDAPAAPSSGPGAPVNSSSYKIGPADILNVRVWNESEFSGPLAVHEDGMITIPLVGDLQAGGSTPVEVQDKISKALAKYVVKPLVTVTVQEVGSKRYYMDGQINRPGEYSLVVPTTVLEAISKAGGTAAYANTKKIYVLRGSRRIPFNYKDVLRGRRMDQNILLKTDDHVVVP